MNRKIASPERGYDMVKHNKDAFDRINEEKRGRILSAAVDEFSSMGFNNANINEIARNAGISIGSMYNYFSSKEDLFLTVINSGYQQLEEIITKISLEEGDIFTKLEELFRAAQAHSKKNRKTIQIYLDMTSEGLATLSKRLSRKVETITAELYYKLIIKAREAGIIRHDIDEKTASFCIDNLIVLLQFSYTTEYFRERMKIFAGKNAIKDDEMVIQGIMKFIKYGLCGKP
ncbi:MAG TPA: TetR/AcrR family transcriptional regulator [Spirochaetota bacterium]|nr:TetR/AcrR family transcriptional regulator [Spirochaetota bacterium]HPI88251.1 TetR/AcrR family transcriptional regulator [Spirochaetota bacterium]HPR47205.1 TetR/AcrR family transcriptional regulator [Spirochaetota bacterium]